MFVRHSPPPPKKITTLKDKAPKAVKPLGRPDPKEKARKSEPAPPPKTQEYNSLAEEAKAHYDAAKTNLASSRNLKSEIKEGVIKAIEGQYQIILTMNLEIEDLQNRDEGETSLQSERGPLHPPIPPNPQLPLVGLSEELIKEHNALIKEHMEAIKGLKKTKVEKPTTRVNQPAVEPWDRKMEEHALLLRENTENTEKIPARPAKGMS
ncbi:hypothetical protein KGM_209912 [Danaus plexippus plexippus]|uniref:Uncharacterized protein n=1 Tax=Danaus plexippus plexippus TaxID=278856 RepID=A0A212FKF1_DANPL|nr:hypothetical protein KGM_209912 [Danaus plexippus plexippus]